MLRFNTNLFPRQVQRVPAADYPHHWISSSFMPPPRFLNAGPHHPTLLQGGSASKPEADEETGYKTAE